MGRSTGAGAVSVWMHHLKDITIIDNYDSPSSSYKGAAVKVSAGVTGEELVGAVDKRGLAIVSGECPVRLPARFPLGSFLISTIH